MMILLLCVLMQDPQTTAKVLIEARMTRNSPALLEEKTMLSMKGQERKEWVESWLLSLGQNGDPRGLPALEWGLTEKMAQAAALLAYGEVEGASTEPLWKLGEKLLPENRGLWEEALSKLAQEGDLDRITAYWQGLGAEQKHGALFYFFRRPTEARTKAVLAWLENGELTGKPAGYFYLQRAGYKPEPERLATWLNTLANDTASLFFALKLTALGGAPALTENLERLCQHADWRVRLFALNALAHPDHKVEVARVRVRGERALADPNPNLVRAAVIVLVKLQEADLDGLLAGKAKLSPSQLQTLMVNANSEQRARFFPLIADWSKASESWKLKRWASLAGEQGTAATAQLLEYSKSRDKGLAALALESLSKCEPEAAGALALEVLSARKDPVMMANALAVLAVLGKGKSFPMALERLDEMAAATYAEPDFQQAYLSNPEQLFDEAGFTARAKKLLNHPDYAVRLSALQAVPGADAAARAQLYATSWKHEVPGEIQQLAAELLTADKPLTWVLLTSKGEVRIALDGKRAPITSANIAWLSRKGYFDQMPFHRVVGNFVVQGGDSRGDGSGGPGYAIPCEINPNRFVRGAVGMALSGKDTGGSQFFICHSPQPHLDGGYTVFGQVLSGMEAVDLLEEGDRILSAKISP